MTNPMLGQAPTGPLRLVAAIVAHSQKWGAAWFGLIFWGSVLNAIAVELWPDTNGWVTGIVSAAIGLAFGLGAKARGRWI